MNIKHILNIFVALITTEILFSKCTVGYIFLKFVNEKGLQVEFNI